MSERRPNILLLVADDMNWDAVGAYGCPTPGTTPNIDRLAGEGIRFDHAHVNIAVCQPSRSVLMTGRYPHRCGGEGFYPLRDSSVAILPAVLRDAGYVVAALGKLGHSTPHAGFAWDFSADRVDLGHGRNPVAYRQRAAEVIASARAAGRPFFLMVNSHDPHRPFHGQDPAAWYQGGGAMAPSRTFAPAEVRTPGFLPDLPEVRQEIAYYYNSVRRCDDTVGATLDLLRETGVAADTLVVFLSDNGMAFPFAKSNCYLQSTKAPWIMRWPGRIGAGLVDRDHFVAGVDLMPTLLEAAAVPAPDGMDGRSFLPLLVGQPQSGRERVYTQFFQSAGKRNFPMRCVQDRRYGYIFNPWSNGERVYVYESEKGQGLTIAAMRRASGADAGIAERLRFMRLRAVEELYDFKNDPSGLTNLATDPSHAAVIDRFRRELAAWMVATADPALAAFEGRAQVAAREGYLAQLQGLIGGES